jgi:hypothetical protein
MNQFGPYIAEGKSNQARSPMVKVSAVLNTDGKGLYSGKEAKVKIIGLRLTKYGYGSYKRTNVFGYLDIYFDPKTWDTSWDGLIYTDKTFEKEALAMLKKQGFSSAALKPRETGYSEQGMQGDDYVNFDIGAKFIEEWEAKYGEILFESSINENFKTDAALMFASALRYVGSDIPIIKDTSLIKNAVELEKKIEAGRNVSLGDLESLRNRLMKDIDAMPGGKRRRIKTYITKLENLLNRDIAYAHAGGDADKLYDVKKRGQFVLKIAKEIERLGLDNS